MRILLITLYYHPDRGGTPGVYKDLCESLQAAGHDVTVVTGFPRYNIKSIDRRYRWRLWLTERIGGVRVKRVRTLRLPRCFPAARALDYVLTALSLFVLALFTAKADAAIVHAPALFEGVAAPILRRLKNMPYVLNVHDIFPQTAIDLGILTNRRAIHFFEWLERYIYARADCVTVHSEGNKKWILHRHEAVKRVEVMPIWMNPDVLKPGPRENPWRCNQGLDGKFTVMFSGSQGYNQDMRVILDAANHLQSEGNIEFVLIGDGTQHDEMARLSKDMGLNNVRWLDWQPEEVYPMVLQSADVVLATLREEVKTPVVPSKVLSAMAAGRPVITCAPLTGDAPKLVKHANAGFTINPGDHEGLAAAIRNLAIDPHLGQQFGKSARCYVEEHLDVRKWAEAHVALFSELIASREGAEVPELASSVQSKESSTQRVRPIGLVQHAGRLDGTRE